MKRICTTSAVESQFLFPVQHAAMRLTCLLLFKPHVSSHSTYSKLSSFSLSGNFDSRGYLAAKIPIIHFILVLLPLISQTGMRWDRVVRSLSAARECPLTYCTLRPPLATPFTNLLRCGHAVGNEHGLGGIVKCIIHRVPKGSQARSITCSSSMGAS
jgi:hypothetical protein